MTRGRNRDDRGGREDDGRFPNSLLCESIYENIFTSKICTATRPVGYALQLAKYAVISEYRGYEASNSKYILLGDPGDAPRGGVVPGRARDRRDRYDADGGKVSGRGIRQRGRSRALILQRNSRRDRARGRAQDTRIVPRHHADTGSSGLDGHNSRGSRLHASRQGAVPGRSRRHRGKILRRIRGSEEMP